MSEWINPHKLPDGDQQKRLHLGRYAWAKEMLSINSKAVANAACSCNYGYEYLKRDGRLVIGFDRNPDGLSQARRDGFSLVVDKDIQEETFDGFDAIVSLETIEHLKDPYAFVKGWSKTVKECVISVPCIPTKHFNEWHLHDFTQEDARKLVRDAGFTVVSEAFQDEDGLPKPTYMLIYAKRT
jgi:2-polyprenyl-3-methyl-5-hydroxy-6-metoxy-1,4-benzoquinol methylase